jgi:PKD repeat protein
MKSFIAIFALILVLVACPVQPPMISSFTSNTLNLPFGGGDITFSWATERATSLSLNTTDVTGLSSKIVTVSSSTVFTLTATNTGGSVTKTVEIVVAPAPPIISSFTASPSTLPFGGGKVTLTWATENTTALSLDGGLGVVTNTTSIEVNITSSKTFTLTATGTGGTTSKTVGIFILDDVPVISSFTATPETLESGLVTLEWQSLGATTLSILPDVGVVAGNSLQVNITKNMVYTLTATNNGGTATKTVVVASTALVSTALGLVNLAWDTSKREAETDSSGQVSFLPLTYSDIDFVSGGVRYLTATYRVTNLSNQPLENLALRVVAKTGNVGQTAAFDIRAFPDANNPDGALYLDPSAGQQILPVHGMQLGATTPVADNMASDFVAYRLTESTALETSAKGLGLLSATESVLDYSYTVKNNLSRRIEANGTGLVSVAVRIPRRLVQSDPLSKIFKFKLSFLLSSDSATRVSRALVETTTASQSRATDLGSSNNPSQLVLIGSDLDAPTGSAFRLIRLPNVRIGVTTNYLP